MYISIDLVENQSSTRWTFNNVQLMLQEPGVEQLPLKRVSVFYQEGTDEYVLVDYYGIEKLPEVEAAIIRIAKGFHTTGLWQAANITAAL